MKKNIILLSSLLLSSLSFLTSCNDDTLLILNWGEYINDELVENFEKEYSCTVNISIADSNEKFYSKVKSGTTCYDLVVPSDYMVQKMVDSSMLQEIEKDKLENYNDENFLPGCLGIMSYMDSCDDIKTNNNRKYYNYYVPYLWGTFGLMYNKNSKVLKDTSNNYNFASIKDFLNEYNWKAYFDTTIIPSNAKVGMYNVPRDAYAASMFYASETDNSMNPNIINSSSLKKAKEVLSMRKFKQWGTDTLKKDVQSGNLDLAFVYTGDFLDMAFEVDPDSISDLDFDICIPDKTIAFMDNLVIPKNARHLDLTYKFINYLLDANNAYLNSQVVGYCTPLKESYNKIIKNEEEPLRAEAYKEYYPLPKETDTLQYKGVPLTSFSKDDLTKLTNLINDIKVSK